MKMKISKLDINEIDISENEETQMYYTWLQWQGRKRVNTRRWSSDSVSDSKCKYEKTNTRKRGPRYVTRRFLFS